MTRYARIEAGQVAELLDLPADGPALADIYPAAMLPQWQALTPEQAATVLPGDLAAGGAFSRPAPDAEAMATAARAARDAALAGTDWMVARHREQLDAGTTPTLAPAAYAALLAYRAALRAWPQQPGWPDLPMPEAPG